MLLTVILLIAIGIVILLMYTLCRVASLSDERLNLMFDPEYLEDEQEKEDHTSLSDVPEDSGE